MKKYLFLLIAFSLFSQDAQRPIKTPQQIQQEIQVAEVQFEKAKKMFNPYYQGPLLTPGAGMTPPGSANVQGYVFVNDDYADFNEDRHSVSLPSSLINLNPAAYFTFGITDTMDGVVVLQGDGNWQYHHSGGGFGDASVSVGWPILVQTRYLPAIKFNIGETFPTGKYQNLDKHLLNSTGEGSYQTQFSIGTAKLILWTTRHPVYLRWWFGYTIPSTVHVTGYNSFGGGPGTRGVVRPGNIFATDLGVEISITQKWVFCTDFVYKTVGLTQFHGRTILPMEHESSDNLSIAPGFEYSWNPNLGVIAGVWFSVYGRNSANFVNGIVSVSYSFP